jgi:hypothetical protein
MTIEGVVKKALVDEHAEAIREAVKAVAAAMMELMVSELIGCRTAQDRATHRNGLVLRRATRGPASCGSECSLSARSIRTSVPAARSCA